MRLPDFLRVRLLRFARRIMESRPPDRVIGGRYLSRWHVIPRNRFFNIYLHKTLASDPGRGVHDHPWASVSLHLEGERVEVMARGYCRLRVPGDVVFRRATTRHKLFQRNGEPVITLFLTAMRRRRWFFYTPDGREEGVS